MTFPVGHPDYHAEQIDRLRYRDFSRLNEAGEVYLDYTGAGLWGSSQLECHFEMLYANVCGNPHSDNPTSLRSTECTKKTRAAVLDFFHADPDVYDVVFTANATAALKLVGESYPFTSAGCFVFTADNHNSVVGIREYAKQAGAAVRYVLSNPLALRVYDTDLVSALTACEKCTNPGRLFAYPAQSNFSGVQHPLSWVKLAHNLGWDVLLDAAAFVGTNRLDLDAHRPDFVAISFYKMFGWPTGVGALITTHEALAKLRRPWFTGGTVWAATVQGGWHIPLIGHGAFEDGTVNFLNLPGVLVGLEYLRELIDGVHERTRLLTEWTLDQLLGLRHVNGRPLAKIYGPLNLCNRGATIAFNFLDPAGRIVDERIVSRAAAKWSINLRTGCFCNPGCGEAAFGLDPDRLVSVQNSGVRNFDYFLTALGMESGGAVRISFGVASNAADAEIFAEFAATLPEWMCDDQDLPARVHC